MQRNDILINKLIDHTLLKPCADPQLVSLCDEAIKYDFASVCVLPSNVAYVSRLLSSSQVKVCSVAAFPLGENTTKSKINEVVDLMQNGAQEIDVVINLSWVLRKEWNKITDELKSVIKEVGSNDVLFKIIVESSFWNKEQLVNVTRCVLDSGAQFIKTSTGFNGSIASVEAVKTMLETIGNEKLLIKASGGIRSFEQAAVYVDLGVKRIGTSNGVEICKPLL